MPGSVITADFYNASALLPLSDDAIVARVKAHLETCEPQVFKGEQGPLVKTLAITVPLPNTYQIFPLMLVC